MKRLRLRAARTLICALLTPPAPVVAQSIGERLAEHLQQAKTHEVFQLCQHFGADTELYPLCALEVVHALELARIRAACTPEQLKEIKR
jgi:hypothetical protein